MHENKIFSGGGFNKEKSCDMLNPESAVSYTHLTLPTTPYV